MKILHYDIETFSECDLKKCGVFRYAEDPSTEMLMMGYVFDDETEIRVWVPGFVLPQSMIDMIHLRVLEKYKGRFTARIINQGNTPEELKHHILAGGETRAHNHQFERVVMNRTAGDATNFPVVEIAQTHCTAAKAAAHGLPRALGDGAEALGTHPKDEGGRIDMLALAKPRRGAEKRYTPQNAPDKWLNTILYNIDDVLAERDLDLAVPDLTTRELRIYHLDQKINERGIRVDMEAVENVRFLVGKYKEELSDKCFEWTGLKPTQRDKIADWIRDNGWPYLLDMQAETVKELCEGKDVPDNCKRVLQLYSIYNMKAVSKYEAFPAAICKDGRLRGMFLYHGAGTGRWSSLIVQLQNLFRPVIDDPSTAIGAFATRDIEWVRDLYPGVELMKVFASCVRGMLIPDPGKDLIFIDFAAIEARILAWFFGEEWKLEAFRAYDAGTGPDMYKLAYARAFQVDPNSISKKSKKRQIGKVKELAFGYEGGVGAMITMADNNGLDLEEVRDAVLPILPERVRESADWMWHNLPATRNGLEYNTYVALDGLKQLWRATHPNVKQGWKDMKAAAEAAVQKKGTAYQIPNGKIAFKVVEYKGREWLYMMLPSKRRLAYFAPEWIPPKLVKVRQKNKYTGVMEDKEKEIPGELRYMGIDTKTRQWKRVTSYGGRWTENGDQGFSADLLRNGMENLEAAEYWLVGSVHDEAICEVDESFGSYQQAAMLMCRQPGYITDLPIAVDGKRAKRYEK